MPSLKWTLPKRNEGPSQVPVSSSSLGLTEREVGTEFGLETKAASSYFLDKEVLISDLELDGIKMPPCNMVVRSRKIVVTTAIAGGNQRPVNEIIANDLHEVRIYGRLIDPDGFPVIGLQQIIDMVEANKELKVNCDYLRMFDIHQIVVTEVEYPDMAGTDNVAAFDITAVSDTPIELELRDGILS